MKKKRKKQEENAWTGKILIFILDHLLIFTGKSTLNYAMMRRLNFLPLIKKPLFIPSQR